MSTPRIPLFDEEFLMVAPVLNRRIVGGLGLSHRAATNSGFTRVTRGSLGLAGLLGLRSLSRKYNGGVGSPRCCARAGSLGGRIAVAEYRGMRDGAGRGSFSGC